MDPQKLSQLDPKLREAYERVMGTAIPEPQAAPAQAQTITPPASDPIPNPQPQPAPSIPQPISEPQPAISPQPEAIPVPQPAIPAQPASNFTQINSEVPATSAATPNFTAPAAFDAAPAPQTQTVTLKKKRGMMMPVLFGITGLIFIVIYTLFWTKIFNLKLPFMP